MANVIEAQIGVNAAPLKKGMDDAASLAKATSKKIADEQKKAAKDAENAEKASLQARANAAKKAAKDAADAKAQFNSKAEMLGNAVPGGSSLGLVGSLAGAAGPAAALLAVVGGIGKSILDARDGAIDMRHSLRDAAREAKFTTAAGSTDEAVKLGEQLREIQKAKEDAQSKMLFGAGMVGGTVSNSRLGAFGEMGLDKIGAMVGAATEFQKHIAQENALIAQQNELIDAGAAAAREQNIIAENAVKVSETEAALQQAKLEADREIESITKRMQSANMTPGQIARATEPVRERLAGQQEEIRRRQSQAATDREDALRAAREQAGIAQTAALSPRIAAQQEIDRLRREEQIRRNRANQTGIQEERRIALVQEADQLKIQGDAAQAQQRIQRGLMTEEQKRQEVINERRRARQERRGERIDATRQASRDRLERYNNGFTPRAIPDIGNRPVEVKVKNDENAFAAGLDKSDTGKALRGGVVIKNQ